MEKKSKKSAIKAPPRGGDAAAAWDHNLKPEDKNALIEQYHAQQAWKKQIGKRVVLIIVAVNAVLAVVSAISDFNAILFSTRMLMCLALFLGAPAIKILFMLGTLVSVVMMFPVWSGSADVGIFHTVVSFVETACLIVSAIILCVDENISDYLYSKRNG